MDKAENQLEAVRKRLASMSKREWAEVAMAADTTDRTLYNLIDPTRKPGYDTVFRVFAALKARDQKPAKK